MKEYPILSLGEEMLPLFVLEKLSAFESGEDVVVGEPPHGHDLVLSVRDVTAVGHYPVPHRIRAYSVIGNTVRLG